MLGNSTYQGKQNVTYYMFSTEGLKAFTNLKSKQQLLIHLILIESDKKDNCLQLSLSHLIAKYEMNKSNSYTLMRQLKELNFVKNVDDITGISRVMVNPKYVFWQQRDNLKFSISMYDLGGHSLAVKHLDLEKEMLGWIDTNTGELHSRYLKGLSLNGFEEACVNDVRTYEAA